ncbi:hypothetical protein DSECCO2_552620 [anaerobic digester metagenome]
MILNEFLNDVGTGGRGPKAVGQPFFQGGVIHESSGMLHGRKECGLGIPGWGGSGKLPEFDGVDGQPIALLPAQQSRACLILVSRRDLGASLADQGCGVSPPLLDTDGQPGLEPAPLNLGDQGGGPIDIIGTEHFQKAQDDKLPQGFFLGVEPAKIHPLLGWNDGMVIGNLQILDKTLLVDPEPFLDKTVTQGLEGCILQTAQPVRQRCDDIGGDVAAVGSWVGDDLVLLIEGLQYIQGLFGAEIKQVVCIPLQLGEVIGKRRLFALFHSLQTYHPARLADERGFQLFCRCLIGDSNRVLGRIIGSAELSEIGFQGPVESPTEGFNLIFAPGHEGQCRCLHPTCR